MRLNKKALKEVVEAVYESNAIRRVWIFPQVVCLIFIMAKVFQLVTFSWWWVFAPMWLPPALILGAFASVAIVIGVGMLVVFLGCMLLDKIDAVRKARKHKKLQRNNNG